VSKSKQVFMVVIRDHREVRENGYPVASKAGAPARNFISIVKMAEHAKLGHNDLDALSRVVAFYTSFLFAFVLEGFILKNSVVF
jgi:hypothetical protein